VSARVKATSPLRGDGRGIRHTPRGDKASGDRGMEGLRVRAARTIRAAILTGELRPEHVYSVPALAERLGMSATPVREAMLELVTESLVRPVRNRGFLVIRLTEHDLDELSQLRLFLEVPAAVAVIGRVGPADHRRLLAAASAIDTYAAAGDLPRFMRADRDFHLGLLGLAGNRRLVQMVDLLRSQSRLFGLPDLAKHGELVPAAREHRSIVDAVIAGDASEVEVVMRNHLQHVRREWAGRNEVEPEIILGAAPALLPPTPGDVAPAAGGSLGRR